MLSSLILQELIWIQYTKCEFISQADFEDICYDFVQSFFVLSYLAPSPICTVSSKAAAAAPKWNSHPSKLASTSRHTQSPQHPLSKSQAFAKVCVMQHFVWPLSIVFAHTCGPLTYLAAFRWPGSSWLLLLLPLQRAGDPLQMPYYREQDLHLSAEGSRGWGSEMVQCVSEALCAPSWSCVQDRIFFFFTLMCKT